MTIGLELADAERALMPNAMRQDTGFGWFQTAWARAGFDQNRIYFTQPLQGLMQ
ncbi:hypothetical protein [Thiobacillus sp.]|uniref:hypothetical protein n=1 Tax=Thiobacillus sp. TaxID=924 RepID=UPI0025E428FF|nr:hypothetical protein [Thiobacillus sp.]